MRTARCLLSLILLALPAVAGADAPGREGKPLFPDLQRFVVERVLPAVAELGEDRRAVLEELAHYIRERDQGGRRPIQGPAPPGQRPVGGLVDARAGAKGGVVGGPAAVPGGRAGIFQGVGHPGLHLGAKAPAQLLEGPGGPVVPLAEPLGGEERAAAPAGQQPLQGLTPPLEPGRRPGVRVGAHPARTAAHSPVPNPRALPSTAPTATSVG